MLKWKESKGTALCISGPPPGKKTQSYEPIISQLLTTTMQRSVKNQK